MAIIQAYSNDSHLDIRALDYRSAQISIIRSVDVKERDNAQAIILCYDCNTPARNGDIVAQIIVLRVVKWKLFFSMFLY